MIVNSIEIADLEINDYDVAVKYEKELDKVARICSNVPQNAKRSETIKTQCFAVFEFFDNLWGNGTANKIFGESCNLLQTLKAYGEAIEAVQAKDKADAETIKHLIPVQHVTAQPTTSTQPTTPAPFMPTIKPYV